MIVNGLTKAKLVFEDNTEIECQFNPAELNISKANSWKPLPGTGRTAPAGSKFVCGSPAKLDLNLVLDTTDSGTPVTDATSKLQALVEIDNDNPAYDSNNKTGRPPWVKFVWGDMVPFKCICTSLSVTYTYFATSGTPLRAKAQISLEQFGDPGAAAAQNPTSGTPKPHRLHTVSPGETIDRIASKYYGSATRWRIIAEANRTTVPDPMRPAPGVVLVIPDGRRQADA